MNGVGMVGGMELLNLDVSMARAAQDTQATQADEAGGSSTQAAAARQASKQLNKKDRQSTLTELVSLGWLTGAPSNNNHYCLGVRMQGRLGCCPSRLHAFARPCPTAFPPPCSACYPSGAHADGVGRLSAEHRWTAFDFEGAALVMTHTGML